MNYGGGYRPDPPEKRTQKDARLLVGASPIAGQGRSLQAYEARILDQGGSSSCGGHGTAQCLAVSFASKGDPLPFVPSPDGIYRLVRCEERAYLTPPGSPLPILSDSGVFPSDIITVLQKWGIHPIAAPTSDGRYSDVERATVNDEPDLFTLERDGEHLIFGVYRVDQAASNSLDQIAAAIDAGYAVGVGAFVDSAFMDWAPGRSLPGTPNILDRNGGGHWLCCDEYRREADGSLSFAGPNSWGTGWGENGRWRASEDWMKAVMDIMIFRVIAHASKAAS